MTRFAVDPINVDPNLADRFTVDPVVSPEVKVTPDEDFDFSAVEMVKNFPSSLKQEAIDIGTALLSPVETGKSIGNILAGTFQKVTGGVFGEEKIKYADAIGKYYAQKYGSFNKFKRELQDNPASVLSDMSMFATGGLTATRLGLKAGGVGQKVLLGVDVARKTTASLDPFNVALNVPSLVAGPASKYLGMGDTAANLYESAVKPSVILDDAERAKIIKTGLEEKITLDKKGKQKLETRIDNLNNRVNNLIDIASNTQKGIPSNIVKKYIGDVKNQVSGFKYKAGKNIDDVERVSKELDKLIKEKATISVRELQDFKTDLYKQLDYDVTKQTGTRAGELAEKSAARAAKEGVSEAVPSVAELNERLSDLLESKPYLIRAANRIGNRDIIGLTDPVKIGAGGTIGGGPGAVIAGGAGLLDRPGIKSRIAIDLYERQNQPLLSLLQNDPTRPLITESLGSIGGINYGGLLSNEEIERLYR